MGKLEDFVQSNKWLCASAGLARRAVWYTTGRGGGDGAHVIFEDRQTGEILTVHPSSEWFYGLLTGQEVLHLPGGGIDHGETPRAAAERECREELSITVDLSSAEEYDVVVQFGLLLMKVTVFRIIVDKNELELPADHPPELLETPRWEDPSKVFDSCTPGTRAALWHDPKFA